MKNTYILTVNFRQWSYVATRSFDSYVVNKHSEALAWARLVLDLCARDEIGRPFVYSTLRDNDGKIIKYEIYGHSAHYLQCRRIFNLFVAEAVSKPLLFTTVLKAVREGSQSIGEKVYFLYAALVKEVGQKLAEEITDAWAETPWKLDYSEMLPEQQALCKGVELRVQLPAKKTSTSKKKAK